MPGALRERPVLDATCSEMVEAFRILSRHRTVGFDVNPIQLSEVRAFIEIYGEPSMGAQVFIELLSLMDEHVRSKPQNG